MKAEETHAAENTALTKLASHTTSSYPISATSEYKLRISSPSVEDAALTYRGKVQNSCIHGLAGPGIRGRESNGQSSREQIIDNIAPALQSFGLTKTCLWSDSLRKSPGLLE